MRTYQRFLIVHRRRENRLRSQSRRQDRLFGLGWGAAAVGLLFFCVGLILFSAVYTDLTRDLPSPQWLQVYLDRQNGLLLQPTRFYDRSGTVLLYTLENPGAPRRFLSVNLLDADHFSPDLMRVITAVYDPDLEKHSGAAIEHLLDPRPFTLAERLANDLLLWQEEPGLRRTLRMRLLAMQLTATYGREQVLEWYLNSTGFGHLAYGAEAAARLYMGKSARDLNIAESALLAALIESPALNPMDAPSAALENQQKMLQRLLTNGQITGEEYQSARDSFIDFIPAFDPLSSPALAFSLSALRQVEDQMGVERVERGGLRVITTLDAAQQTLLGCTLTSQLERLEGKNDLTQDCEPARLLPTLTGWGGSLLPGTETSALLYEPRSGQVLAYWGGLTLEGESGLPDRRQPGSVLGPLVSLAAFTRGMSPGTLVWDISSSLPEELKESYIPLDGYQGPLRLRTATVNSYLAPLLQVFNQIGAPVIEQVLRPVGIRVSGQMTADVLIQGGDISLAEIAQAYGTIDSLGLQSGIVNKDGSGLEAAFLLRVEGLDGKVWLDFSSLPIRTVLTPQLAYLAHDMLSDEAARWLSLGYPNALEIGRPAGALAGTTQDQSQVWAVGYTPQYLTVVWMGLPETSRQQLDVEAAAGVWHAWMQYLHRDLPVLNWEQPDGVTRMEVCDPSGLLLTRDCPNQVSEVFISGNEPVSADTLYRRYTVNRQTGNLATVFTAPELVEEQVFMVIPPEAAEWSQMAHLPLPPADYDLVQIPTEQADVRFIAPGMFSVVHGKVMIRGTAGGENFLSYSLQIGEGINPQEWLQIGAESSKTVTNGDLGTWDTSGLNGLYVLRMVVLRADQSLETALVQVTVDNTPPVARIQYPMPGDLISARQDVIFRASAEDAVGVRKLTWLLDGKRLADSETAPYYAVWKATAGSHRLQVVVVDLAGNESRSDEVIFEVK